MPALTITVQPPREMQVGEVVYPPVIGNLVCQRPHDGYYFFAMAVLLQFDGSVIDGGLTGTTVSTGVALDATDSSRPSVVFAFPGMTILYRGVYRIRLDVYMVAYEHPDRATLGTQAETRNITILEEPVAYARPSDRERDLMRSLRRAGIPVPEP
ncbi:hypothetical protein AK830_g2872 [Neonectria ditissima]|uniref:Velvet domain-containing protein n=1 Tax=Neonectria ditissima TaxID=78410 RepID=A0A0P7BR75_9HYPO|nr:hypothetical protein AK830_g2872 [Neonectria ditissima]